MICNSMHKGQIASLPLKLREEVLAQDGDSLFSVSISCRYTIAPSMR
jgi:hypothetical protein